MGQKINKLKIKNIKLQDQIDSDLKLLQEIKGQLMNETVAGITYTKPKEYK